MVSDGEKIMAFKNDGPIRVRGDSTANELRVVGRIIEGGHRYGPGMGRAALVMRALFPAAKKNDEYWTAVVFLDRTWRTEEEKNLMAMLLYLAAEILDDHCVFCGHQYD